MKEYLLPASAIAFVYFICWTVVYKRELKDAMMFKMSKFVGTLTWLVFIFAALFPVLLVS